ncbi:type VI secretion system contractile sheath small subunit [Nannocystis bainbridge]|uniref:Type VI secretion system contractile sheath small subunit n=1 Tax=Nannocystis bainbridge TaxID=2995303 RepID=A0ABT5E5A4_9BACT|nr:type VI secretion system contractile sheath small subunit [Nannocystis bainbridge]MDC0721049.1 type VI secretion system contractile sheath small subunit [Nannocystis bainbridge]
MSKGKDGSVAPKERVNITYKPATDGAQEDVELPLKILMLGDFTGRQDDRPVEERVPINVDKDNFDKVMAAQKLETDISVTNKLTDGDQGDLSLSLKFDTLKDFRPEGIVEQVPQLKELMELRNALTALKGPLVGGNVPDFKKKLVEALRDPDKRNRLMKELGIEDKPGS